MPNEWREGILAAYLLFARICPLHKYTSLTPSELYRIIQDLTIRGECPLDFYQLKPGMFKDWMFFLNFYPIN